MILVLVNCVVIDLLACLQLFFFIFVRVIKPIFAIDNCYLNLFVVVSLLLDWHGNLIFVYLAFHFVLSLIIILLFLRLVFLRLGSVSRWPVHCIALQQYALVSISRIFYPSFLSPFSGHELTLRFF